MNATFAPPRTVEQLQQLQAEKARELAAVQDELETAQWLAAYDAAKLYSEEQR